MEHFVTLFNSLFLPQGLALHNSMERHVKNYVLWILCVDDETYDLLTRLQLPNTRLLRLIELETDELLAVKPDRSISEYCWTLTPFAPRFVFDADSSVKRVTYIDADLWFRKNPKPVFDEFFDSEKFVLITDHAYAPEYDISLEFGQYCVQFMIFNRVGGEVVRKWWEDRCIEWCYARPEEGKFGDQKYLDDWPDRFGELVHVLQNKELIIAPWNASRYPYGQSVAFHFHGLRLTSKNTVEIDIYNLPEALKKNVYQLYFKDLKESLKLLEKCGMSFTPQAKSKGFMRRYYNKLKRIKEKLIPLLTDTELRF